MFRQRLTLLAVAVLMAGCGQPQPASPPDQAFTVYFANDSSNLSKEATGTLDQAAAAYKSAGGARVSVSAYTDTTGTAEYNKELSQRRASAVVRALVQNGVPATAIAASANGEKNLPVPTADQVAEKKNRAVVVTVSSMAAAPDTGDLAYCRALSAKYRDFARANVISPPLADAMYQCDTGNSAAAIPVLERALNDAKVPLPPRT
jgi:ABC-type glycerol-3-phosphate transport system substrate-binding protein